MKTQRTRRWTDLLSARALKFVINCWPPFWGAGIKIKTITSDYRFIDVRMKLRWYNTNLIGTHFGGSIYSMTDPFYMLILLKNLGNDYIVWDKAAQIEFKKPGRGELKTIFTLTAEQINHVREQADQQGKYVFDCPLEVLDENKEIVAALTKTLYVRKKSR